MDWKTKEYWLVLVLIGATAFYTNLLKKDRISVVEPIDFSQIPHSRGGWVGREAPLSASVLDVLKAHKTLLRKYVNTDGSEIWLFIAYWDSQKYGAQPHSPLHCLPGSGWEFLSRDRVPMQLGVNRKDQEGRRIVNFATITDGRTEEAILYWYKTRHEVLASELGVKLSLAKHALSRRPTDVAFVRINTPLVSGDKDETWAAIEDFWGVMGHKVLASLP